MKSLRMLLPALLLASSVAGQGIPSPYAYDNPANAQPGNFTNFEYAHGKPILVQAVGAKEYLFVCNTPNNSLEIYDLANPDSPVFVDRIKVGLRPVTVRYNTHNNSLYTCNALGDSVSRISVAVDASNNLTWMLERTDWVGDEPYDIAFDYAGTPDYAYVSLNSRGALAIVNPDTLVPYVGDPFFPLKAPAVVPTSVNPAGWETCVIKEPRTIINHTAPGVDVWYVLGARGTHVNHGNSERAFDLYVSDHTTTPFPVNSIKRLGTKNFNMCKDSNGILYVVSGDAVNKDIKRETNVAAAKTGFLRTLLHRIDINGGAPIVRTRDLNEDNTGTNTPVDGRESLSHAVDVVVYEGPTTKVYVSAFNQDAIGVITGTANADPLTWTRSRIALPGALSQTAIAGPTGLAVHTGAAGTGDDRIYVVCRLDGTVHVVNPSSDTVTASFALEFDPTPDHVMNGRHMLYSAKVGQLSNGFNSCASCHLESRLDGQRWDLSNTADVVTLSAGFFSGTIVPSQFGSNFPQPKGELITQSLQGLINSEVEPGAAGLVSNEPYHWRGDRAQFNNFNGAFAGLLGGSGVGFAEMEPFRTFINSVHYPPNPEQDISRRYLGNIGTFNNTADGSGSLRGLKLFHIQPLAGVTRNLSCVQCHALPEGSNNLATENFDTFLCDPNTQLCSSAGTQPFETAALRGLLQKETAFIELPPLASALPNRSFTPTVNTNPAIKFSIPLPAGAPVFGVDVMFPQGDVSLSGLFHGGENHTINDFNQDLFLKDVTTIFDPSTGALSQAQREARVSAMTQYTREFDTGVAPMAGISITIRRATDVTGNPATVINLMEQQVSESNAGLAVVAVINGTPRGFWCDVPPGSAAMYREGATGAWMTRTALLALLDTSGSDVMVFQGTPLGEDRRTAAPNGQPAFPPTGTAPSNVHFEPMAPNTANEPIPSMNGNWDPAAAAPLTFSFMTGIPEPWDLKSIRYMQRGNGQSAGSLRHEAPRRFRVSGDDIRHGAWVTIGIPNTGASAPPYTSATPPVPGTPGSSEYLWLNLPLYPTDDTGQAGRRIWETAVEFDSMVVNALMLGWTSAPGVGQMFNRANVLALTTLPSFSPATWNQYYVQVTNEDGTVSPASLTEAITLTPPGWTH